MRQLQPDCSITTKYGDHSFELVSHISQNSFYKFIAQYEIGSHQHFIRQACTAEALFTQTRKHYIFKGLSIALIYTAPYKLLARIREVQARLTKHASTAAQGHRDFHDLLPQTKTVASSHFVTLCVKLCKQVDTFGTYSQGSLHGASIYETNKRRRRSNGCC